MPANANILVFSCSPIGSWLVLPSDPECHLPEVGLVDEGADLSLVTHATDHVAQLAIQIVGQVGQLVGKKCGAELDAGVLQDQRDFDDIQCSASPVAAGSSANATAEGADSIARASSVARRWSIKRGAGAMIWKVGGE